ncbi:MAG: helix-turn-helix transcriptional regulator [Lachnospiraceae bacterium]|nr:helix-turn-helix transcriptional regulator [Lachnospiraceae bacterium]
MNDWEKHKTKARAQSPVAAEIIDEAETASMIVGVMINRRKDLKLTQRDLAKLCGIPQSSVARIESGVITPNLSTLLKIFKQLRLCFLILPEGEKIKATK